jgi:hypothetical protein
MNEGKLIFVKDGLGSWFSTNSFGTAWHHIAIVKSGNTGANLSIYIDGVLDSVSSVGSVSVPSGTKRMGQDGGFGNWFQGLLDEVRIYNRALTASEIAAIYNNTP